MSKIRYIILFLFSVSLLFENLVVQGAGRNYTYSLILFLLYAITCIPLLKYISNCIRLYKKPMLYSFAFLILLVFSDLINSSSFEFSLPTTIISFYFLMFVLLLHFTYEPRAINVFCLGFAFGVTLLTACFFVGLGIDYGEYTHRLTMFGLNANNTGYLADMGAAIILYFFILDNTYNLNAVRFVAFIPLAGIVGMILALASRSAFIGLILIIITSLLFFSKKSKSTKFLYILLCCMAIYLYFSVYADYEVLFNRLLSSVEERGDSARTDRWIKLFPHTFDSPLFGIGETGFAQLVGSKDISGDASPHNVVLEVCLYTGYVGLFCMLKFWFSTAKAAISSYKTYRNLIFILISIPVIVMILTGQALNFKIVWAIYALMLS